MSKKKPPTGPKKPVLKKEDVALWKAMTQDVKRAPGQDYAQVESVETPPKKAPLARKKPPMRDFSPPPTRATPRQSADVDKRTLDRLRRGLMAIDARIDLHGLGQDAAYAALAAFIQNAYERGLRCVLVITGKGKSQKLSDDARWFEDAPGVLRQRAPEWLHEGKLRDMVLKSCAARPKDGGEGALYVLLRRRR